MRVTGDHDDVEQQDADGGAAHEERTILQQRGPVLLQRAGVLPLLGVDEDVLAEIRHFGRRVRLVERDHVDHSAAPGQARADVLAHHAVDLRGV